MTIAIARMPWPSGVGGATLRWGRSGYSASIVLHLVAGALVVAWTFRHIEAAAPVDKPIELVIEQPEPEKPKEIVPPKPQPIQPPQHAPKVAAPRPAPAATPQVQSAAPLQQAEPLPDTPPAVAAPVQPPAPAPEPVAAPAPKVAHDGIPTDYVNKVFARINRIAAGHYPKSAMLKGQEGRVAYRLVLSPQGELLRYEIDPSGVEALDHAAEDALKAAAPFPKLPDLGAASYTLSGVIAYKLTS